MSEQGRHLERLFFSSPILIVFLLLSLPGILLLTYYFFSLKYVPTVDIFQASYVVAGISVVLIIPFIVLMFAMIYPVWLHRDSFDGFDRAVKSNLVFYHFISWLFSVIVGLSSFMLMVYYRIDGVNFYVYSCLIGVSIFSVLVLYLKSRKVFPELPVVFILSFAVYLVVFSSVIQSHLFFRNLDGYDRSISIVVGFFIFFSSAGYLYYSAVGKDKKLVIGMVVSIFLVAYALYCKPIYKYIVEQFVTAKDVAVVYQEKNGCKLFIGGGTVEDGACIAEGVNVLSNLGDYYLFEKGGIRYEVMKEKGIRLIFPANSESKAEPKNESEQSSPAEDNKKDTK